MTLKSAAALYMFISATGESSISMMVQNEEGFSRWGNLSALLSLGYSI